MSDLGAEVISDLGWAAAQEAVQAILRKAKLASHPGERLQVLVIAMTILATQQKGMRQLGAEALGVDVEGLEADFARSSRDDLAVLLKTVEKTMAA